MTRIHIIGADQDTVSAFAQKHFKQEIKLNKGLVKQSTARVLPDPDEQSYIILKNSPDDWQAYYMLHSHENMVLVWKF